MTLLLLWNREWTSWLVCRLNLYLLWGDLTQDPSDHSTSKEPRKSVTRTWIHRFLWYTMFRLIFKLYDPDQSRSRSPQRKAPFCFCRAMQKRVCFLFEAKISSLPGVVGICFWVARLISKFFSRKILFSVFSQTESPPPPFLLRHHDFSNGPPLNQALNIRDGFQIPCY